VVIPTLNTNWVDLVILALYLYFLLHTINRSFWSVLADFLAFLLSLLVALKVYGYAGKFIGDNFSMDNSLASAVGFLVVAIVTETLLHIVFNFVLQKMPPRYLIKNKIVNQLLSLFPAFGEAMVVISFLVILVMALPISPKIRKDVADSQIGGVILKNSTGLESRLNEVFGEVIDGSLTYLTVYPGSEGTVELTAEITELSIDAETEKQMLSLVNEERKKAGVGELVIWEELVVVARSHARDMWERKYFSHFSPDGEDVGDRLEKNNVGYLLAGENLAMAPTLTTAHTGLMNSEGHRKNLLDPGFEQAGIGVIDNGVYGKMFVQIFTN